jgi:hypothetical protein
VLDCPVSQIQGGEGGQWAGRPAVRSPQVGAVEEAAAVVRVLDF